MPKRRYTINPETLRLRVESVSYATSIREGRPASAGVRFQDKRIWSVDGYRMAIHEDDSLNISEPFILPAAAYERDGSRQSRLNQRGIAIERGQEKLWELLLFLL